MTTTNRTSKGRTRRRFVFMVWALLLVVACGNGCIVVVGFVIPVTPKALPLVPRPPALHGWLSFFPKKVRPRGRQRRKQQNPSHLPTIEEETLSSINGRSNNSIQMETTWVELLEESSVANNNNTRNNNVTATILSNHSSSSSSSSTPPMSPSSLQYGLLGTVVPAFQNYTFKKSDMKNNIYNNNNKNVSRTSLASWSRLYYPNYTKPTQDFAAWSSSLAQNITTKTTHLPKISKTTNSKTTTQQKIIAPNQTLTLADLEFILQANGYLKQGDLDSILSSSALKKNNKKKKKKKASHWLLEGQQASSTKTNKGERDPDDDGENDEELYEDDQPDGSPRNTKTGAVAFPQPSVLSYKLMRRTTTIAGGFVGMVLGTTILPNLWLVGAFLGCLYGYEITKRDEQPSSSNIVARWLVASGRKLAKLTLQVTDYWKTLWFLYKTGQLSYEYYKTYENLDRRFAIQNKVDAWNSRFQEGKIKFDNWERENEIGRTILAGIRTVWLVDEQSKKRAASSSSSKNSSRYRLVQYLYDLQYWFLQRTRQLGRYWQSRQPWNEVWLGIQNDLKISGWDAFGTRLGAVIAALIAVNICGALFAISQTFVFLVAVSIGVIWPSWVPELAVRVGEVLEETRARGRGDEDYASSSRSTNYKENKVNTAKLLKRYDKNKYHYFSRPDGSKRYYRTGQSIFGRSSSSNNNKKKSDDKLSLWPWKAREKQRRATGQEQWGIFGRKS